jgi:TPR repeat protein
MKKIMKMFVLSTLSATVITAINAEEVNENLDMVFTEEIWEKNQENRLAQFYLAEQHFMKKEYDKALNWYLKAAFQNLDSSVKNVQFMIQNKMGVASNMDEVVKFMTIFADKGDEYSQMYLGNIYRDGNYQENMKKSYYWYTMGAENGNPFATYFSGVMTLKGLGTIQNVPKSLRILEKLAEEGHFPSIYTIAKTYKTGYKIAKNHEVAVKWFDMAAKEGHVNSMFELADSYDRGFGVKKDHVKAYEWFESAALKGHVEATYRAGVLKLFGDNADLDQAMEWLSIASVEGHEKAKTRLGDIFYKGDFGVKEDYVKAIHHYLESAEGGNASSYRQIALIYRKGGNGVERDVDSYEKYIKLFYKNKNKPMTSLSEKNKVFGYDIFDYKQDI